MISESFIYWFTRLDHLHSFISGLSEFCIIVCIALGVTFGITFIGKHAEEDDDIRSTMTKSNIFAKKWFICAVIAECLICAMHTMLPTTKEMAAIYVIPKIANNENVQEIGSELASLAKEWLKELHPTNVTAKVNNAQKK